MKETEVRKAYELAADRYAAIGVDANAALKKIETIPISLHCWQGDDVGGFENPNAQLSGGGIQATGNYPGKARNVAELRADLEKAFSLIPGKHRLNLHACYLENGGKFVDRNEIEPRHFQGWIDWAKANGLGMDFNPTYFSHSKVDGGFTLSHPDKSIRDFWIEHGIACRKIATEIGRQIGSPVITNFWMPDGFKDIPANRLAPRELMAESLDRIFAEPIATSLNVDAVESKLFGIGAESYTVGSHEFFMGYAVSRRKALTLDSGHFHPTEVISDKISSVLMFCPQLLLHVSRPVRWDSDHVVILDDELLAIAKEVVRSGQLERIHIGLDYFDASINRVAAWVTGTRNMLKAMLIALLEPETALREAELVMNYTKRLVTSEEQKSMPWTAVWDFYCLTQNVPVGIRWFSEIEKYETESLSKRMHRATAI
jgi:L-rhamnose isomerase